MKKLLLVLLCLLLTGCNDHKAATDSSTVISSSTVSESSTETTLEDLTGPVPTFTEIVEAIKTDTSAVGPTYPKLYVHKYVDRTVVGETMLCWSCFTEDDLYEQLTSRDSFFEDSPTCYQIDVKLQFVGTAEPDLEYRITTDHYLLKQCIVTSTEVDTGYYTTKRSKYSPDVTKAVPIIQATITLMYRGYFGIVKDYEDHYCLIDAGERAIQD